MTAARTLPEWYDDRLEIVAFGPRGPPPDWTWASDSNCAQGTPPSDAGLRCPVRARRDRSGGPGACWPRVRFGEHVALVVNGVRKQVSARHAAWLETRGELPPRYSHVEVSCGTILCLNPAHLYMQTEEQRFWSKVDKSAGPDGCWLWTGPRTRGGYGQFQYHKREDNVVIASRYVWFLHTGTMPPPEVFLCHHCDNRICVNPKHLFPGSAMDNTRDMLAKEPGDVITFGDRSAIVVRSLAPSVEQGKAK